MKAPFSYFGGKAGLAPRIVELLPRDADLYMEPFFGSGQVFFRKPPHRNEIINDADGALVTFFRVLRDRPEELERACALTPYARAEYAAADLDADGLDDLEVARRFWVRVSQSFTKSASAVTGWSITRSCNASRPWSVHRSIDRFMPAAARLTMPTIECCDAVDLIHRVATAGTVIYVDPPYLERQRIQQDYRVDMITLAEHERLLDALLATDATVILSGYHSDLYDQALADWWVEEHHVMAHTSNALTAAGSRSARVEVLWSNRDLGGTPSLFDEEWVLT